MSDEERRAKEFLGEYAVRPHDKDGMDPHEQYLLMKRWLAPQPGEMHGVDSAFYNLAIKQRNAAWRENENLRAEITRLQREKQ